MKRALKNRTALLIIDAIIFTLCIFGVYRASQKAYLPFQVKFENSHLIVSEINYSSEQFQPGDIIKFVDNYSFKDWEEVEIYTDSKNVNDTVTVSYIKNGLTFRTNVKLSNYYSLSELIIISLVGLIFILLPVFVILKSDDRSAVIFHFASIGLAMVITMTPANYSIKPVLISKFIHILYLFAFCLTPVLFIHFIINFTGVLKNNIRILPSILYTIAVLIAGSLSYLFLKSVQTLSLEFIHAYVSVYNYFFRVFLLLSVFIILFILLYAYRNVKDYVSRSKIKWMLYGFSIGPLAFALLWAVPLLIFGYSFIPIISMHLLMISFPLTISIAIVKYHFMNIDFIINRSIVYSIVLAGEIIIFVFVFYLITYSVKKINDVIPAVFAAVLIAFLLQPIKNKTQKFVDKKFFRIHFNFREAQRNFLNDIKNSNDIKSLAQKVVTDTDELIPVEKIGFFILQYPRKRIKLIAHKNFDLLVNRSLRFQEEKLKSNLSLPVAVDDKVELGLNIEFADREVFKRWGMVIVFPVKSPSGKILAFLVLGNKKSGQRFHNEDIDLLNSVCNAVGLTIERIILQRELIRKQLEAERLEELNRMKSLFVSTVSHELKTPLTSIKMFAEMLKDNTDCSTEKAQEYLRIIEGESERLKRLINNVLDFTRIEKGIKTYEKNKVELNSIISEVLRSMEYHFKIAGISLDIKFNKQPYIIFADKDAVEEAVMNILSNAIKYSKKNTSVSVSTFEKEKYACVKVTDRGIGISESNIKKIFEPFYRHESDLVKAEGTGLGLAIVKHIMDAHNGKIEVESEPGKGSAFTLLFPRED